MFIFPLIYDGKSDSNNSEVHNTKMTLIDKKKIKYPQCNAVVPYNKYFRNIFKCEKR